MGGGKKKKNPWKSGDLLTGTLLLQFFNSSSSPCFNLCVCVCGCCGYKLEKRVWYKRVVMRDECASSAPFILPPLIL